MERVSFGERWVGQGWGIRYASSPLWERVGVDAEEVGWSAPAIRGPRRTPFPPLLGSRQWPGPGQSKCGACHI